MKKRIISLLLVFVFCLSLCACNGDSGNESGDNNNTTGDVYMEFLNYSFSSNTLKLIYRLSGEVKNDQKISVGISSSNGAENKSFTADLSETGTGTAEIELSSTMGEVELTFSVNSAEDPEEKAFLLFNNKRPQLSVDSVNLVANSMNESEMASILVGYYGKSEDKVVKGSYQLNSIVRFGVPTFVMADASAGVRIFPAYTTWYPSCTMVASSWDTEIAEFVGKCIGEEAKLMGVDAILGPGMNIHRSIFGGRNSEYYSEDPLLSGLTAAAYIRGMQSTGTIATIKHYATNNQETDRTNMSSNVSERALREIYLKNFGYAIKEGDPKMLMTTYNKLNGIYTSNFEDLIKVARDELGFDGAITTDWSTNADVITNILYGNDMTNPGTREQYEAVTEAITKGTIPKSVALTSVKRILKLIASSNSMGNYRTDKIEEELGKQNSLKVAEAGIVLLKNNAGTLPFASGEVALFGVGSYTTVKGQQGSGWVNSRGNLDIVDSFELEDSPYTVNKTMKNVYSDKDSHWDALPSEPILTDAKISESANEADIALITISRLTAEGTDLKDEAGQYRLTDDETSMINRVSSTYHSKGKKVVVVINTCNPIEVVSWRDKVDAILYVAPGGSWTGTAVMNVLSGKANPSGKLATTWPVEYSDLPYAETFGTKGDSEYNEDIYVGYRYNATYDLRYAWEFGYGLSYTNFTYSDIKLDKTEFSSADDTVTAEITVTNSGSVAGKEVVQLYVSKPETLVDQVARELVGFDKTNLLAPGESETIKITITSYELESFIEARDSWVVSNGSYKVSAAASSFDLKSSATFTVANEIVTSTVTTDLTGKK